MRPLTFSFSSLSTFVNCPRRYHAQYVLKTVKDDPNTPHLVWGNRVHKDFELRQRDGVPLPKDIAMHEPMMKQLEALDGEKKQELRIAFGPGFKPTEFFGKDAIYRSVVDFIAKTHRQVTICDHKSGKRNPKWTQLYLNAIWAFNAYPTISHVEMNFYWTQVQATDTQRMSRDEWKRVWSTKIEPDLRQYVQAFQEDIWQPRRSGLCRAHCPVLDCEHNGRNQ